MRPVIARATLQLLYHLKSNTPYAYIAVSTGVTDSLIDVLEKRPYIDQVRYQAHETTRENVAIIVKHAEAMQPPEILDSTVRAIKLWHEIETGWLNCTPPIEIHVQERTKITKELFEPQDDALGRKLGRVLAEKARAMMEGRYDLVSKCNRREAPLWQELMFF